jgi:hypothetical protein
MMIPADVRTAVVLRPQTNRSLPFDFRLKPSVPSVRPKNYTMNLLVLLQAGKRGVDATKCYFWT